MGNFFNALFEFIKPAIIFYTSMGSIIAFLLGALSNPQGLMNKTIVGAIDFIANLFPSTPDNLKIATLINSMGDSIPLVGRAVIRETFFTIASIAAISLAIKIYKLLPFKAT